MGVVIYVRPEDVELVKWALASKATVLHESGRAKSESDVLSEYVAVIEEQA